MSVFKKRKEDSTIFFLLITLLGSPYPIESESHLSSFKPPIHTLSLKLQNVALHRFSYI